MYNGLVTRYGPQSAASAKWLKLLLAAACFLWLAAFNEICTRAVSNDESRLMKMFFATRVNIRADPRQTNGTAELFTSEATCRAEGNFGWIFVGKRSMN